MTRLSNSVLVSTVLLAGAPTACVTDVADELDGVDDRVQLVIPPGPDEVTDSPSSVPKTLAPGCVWRRQTGSRRLVIVNDCETDQWIKVIIAWGPDSDCWGLVPGEGIEVTWTLGWFDRLESC